MLKIASSVLALSFLLAGCRSDQTLPGVVTAVATRHPDGRVAVTATLQCMIIVDAEPGDDSCSSAGTTVCVNASWIAASSATPIATAKACAQIGTIDGATIVVTSTDPIPQNESLTIVIATDQQNTLPTNGDGGITYGGEPQPSVTIASP